MGVRGAEHGDIDGTMSDPHLSLTELEAGLDEIRRSPKDAGALRLIVRRPQVNTREVLQEGQLDLVQGLVGDTWAARVGFRSHTGGAARDTQINVMNARAIGLVAQSADRWALAGDQLFIDLDLSADNLPPGTRLALGSAIIEVTEEPHTGCGKFAARFGVDAVKFVNSTEGKRLRLRGLNARVVQPGLVRVGDLAQKL
jgi:MOSC domain-containing protein YiiM